MSWRDHAACKGADTNLWFPERGGEQGRDAKAICASCPVKEPCAEDGYGEEGIWGGRSARRARRYGAA